MPLQKNLSAGDPSPEGADWLLVLKQLSSINVSDIFPILMSKVLIDLMPDSALPLEEGWWAAVT